MVKHIILWTLKEMDEAQKEAVKAIQSTRSM